MHRMESLQVVLWLPSKEEFLWCGFQVVLVSNETDVRGFTRATKIRKYLTLHFENCIIHLSVLFTNSAINCSV